MSRPVALLRLATGFALCLVAEMSALEIPLYIDETAGVGRREEPVSTGVPLSRGSAVRLDQLNVRTSTGESVPAQFRALSRWPDDSLKWVLVDFQAEVEASGRAVYILRFRRAGIAPRSCRGHRRGEGAGSLDRGYHFLDRQGGVRTHLQPDAGR